MNNLMKIVNGALSSVYTTFFLIAESEERRILRLRAAERRQEEASRKQQEEEEEELTNQRLRAADRSSLRQRVEEWRRREQERNQRLQVARRNKRLRAANRRIEEERARRIRVEEENRRLREQNQRLRVARRTKRARAAERPLEITQVQNRRLLGNVIAHYEIQNHANLTSEDFLTAKRPLVTDFFRRNPRNKFQLSLNLILVKVDAAGNVVEEEETCLSTKQEIVYESTDVDETYDRMVTKIIELFSKFLKNGSGWRLKRVVKLIITKSRQNPNRGSSHIPLPKKIKDRKALINMKNKDNQCFKWAVMRALNPVTRDSERITKELRKQANELNWDGIEFPTPCTEK